MQLQIDPNIPSNVPDEELRDFQSFIQTALDGLTAAAGGEVMALGTGYVYRACVDCHRDRRGQDRV